MDDWTTEYIQLIDDCEKRERHLSARHEETPAERWTRVRAWVAEQIGAGA